MTLSIDEHNAEAQAVWAAFHAGRPIRPPANTQYSIFNHDLNPGDQVSFEAYSTDARTMLAFQLRAVASCCGKGTTSPPILRRQTWPLCTKRRGPGQAEYRIA